MSLPSITAPPGTPAFLVAGHAIEEDSVYAQVRPMIGHSRARRVWTVVERVVSVSWVLEAEQLEAVDDWFERALLVGSRDFAAEIMNQGAGARKLWWRAKWIAPFDVEMLHRGRGRVTGQLLLTGEGTEQAPTPALAMEIAIPLVGIAGRVVLPTDLAAEFRIGLTQRAELAMEIDIALENQYPPTAEGWNPADKDSDIAISGTGDTIATLVSTGSEVGAIRGLTGRDAATANHYFEVTVTTTGTLVVMVGIGNGSATLANYPGVDANAWAYYSHTGESYTNNDGDGYGATYSTGDVIGVHLNAGTLTFYKNGASQGTAYTGITGTVYPMWGPATVGAATRVATINTGQSAMTLPGGSSNWG